MAIGNPITLTNNIASKIVSVTATADQTLFTVTGGYRVNQLAVFRNGVKLSQSSDFIANDGSSVTLSTPANTGDNIDFQVFDEFRVSDAIVSAASSQTIFGDLAVNGNIYFNNTDLEVGIVTASGGFNIGIQSAGTDVATGVITALNFIGDGNDITYDSSSKTVDINIAGGGGLGTAIPYANGVTPSPFSYINTYAVVDENMIFDTTNSGADESIIVSVSPNVEISPGIAVTVDTGKTMIIDALQIGDL